MNDYVLAQLNKLVVDTRVKVERVRSLQRQTPSLGSSNTRQIVLQRQLKELVDQARTWELAMTLLLREEDHGTYPADGS